jgi:hypothetical protein
VYAHYQHEGLDLNHPRGGRPRYLGDPMLEQHAETLAGIARRTITEDGSDLRGAMKDTAEGMSRMVQTNAPVEFNDLRRSGHPSVVDNGATIYDRPPEVARLTEDELRAKHGRRRGVTEL